MKLIFLVLFEIVTCQFTTKWTPPTPGLYERVEILKHKLNKQIQQKQKEQKTQHKTANYENQHIRTHLIAPINIKGSINDNFEYEDIEKDPVTPIMDFDDRKKKNKFRLRKIKPKINIEILTTPETDIIPMATPKTFVNKTIFKKLEDSLRIKRPKAKKPMTDIFYRRYTDDKKRNEPAEWSHCQCLISPFLNGFKTDMTAVRRVTISDNIVTRLVQLLTEDTTYYTKEEVYSIMYQVSNMQLRFFDWDINAVEHLLGVISADSKHTFRTIKAGLKNIFAKWRLTLGNKTNLIKQSRVYRPPCVKTTDHSGSTKSSQVVRFYTKPTSPKTKCSEDDDEDEC